MKGRIRIAVVVALGLIAPMLMAPSGGFPSRPRFQTVGVGVAAPTSGIAITAPGTVALKIDRTATESFQIYQGNGNGIVFLDAATPTGNFSFANNGVPNVKFTASGLAQFVGLATTGPTSGAGVEIFANGSNGYVQSYDRTGSAYRPLHLQGLGVYVADSGANPTRIPKIVYGQLDCLSSGTCAVNTGEANQGITGTTRPGTGTFTFQFAAFAVAPLCIGTATSGGIVAIDSTSTTNVLGGVTTDAGAAVNQRVNVVCYGN